MRAAVLVALLTAIAVPALAQDTPESKVKQPKRQPNVITLEEIEAVRHQAGDALAVVRQLRPQFLRHRGASSMGNASGGRTSSYARVVVDGMPRGGSDVLGQIPSMTIKEIRYLSASDASTRFGTGYDGGAILITTR